MASYINQLLRYLLITVPIFHILYEQANTLYQTDIHTAPTTNKPGTASLSTRGIDIDHELQFIVKMTAQVHMKRWQWPKTPFEHECVW